MKKERREPQRIFTLRDEDSSRLEPDPVVLEVAGADQVESSEGMTRHKSYQYPSLLNDYEEGEFRHQVRCRWCANYVKNRSQDSSLLMTNLTSRLVLLVTKMPHRCLRLWSLGTCLLRLKERG